MSLSERIDRLVAAVWPQAAAERVAARLSLESLSNYRGAFHSRTDRTTPTLRGAGPDWTLEKTYDRRSIVDRARQLEANSVLAEAMLSRATESVVGVGFGLQCKTADKEWNKAAEALWSEWSMEADSRGILCWEEILAMAYRSWLRDGDVGLVKQRAGTIRVLESDEIASPEGYSRPDLVDGIELDQAGRFQAFHVVSSPRDLIPDRRSTYDRVRVPAKYVEFIARRNRAGQTRGVSAFSGVSWILDQIDGNLEAITVANRMAACMGLVFKRKSRMSGLGSETGADGIARKRLRLEPGAFLEIEPDEDITTVQGNSVASQFGEFARILGRLASMAFGLPLEITFMDFERTNYSNARAALLQAWNVWRTHQRMLKALSSRVYRWKVLNWMEAGLLPIRADGLAHRWMAPGWQWLDPVAEVNSNLAAIDAGFRTRTEVAMQQGQDFEELVEVLKSEREAMESAGIPVVHSSLTRDEMPEPVAPAGESPDAKAAKQAAESRHEERLTAAIERMSAPPSVVVNNAQPAPVVALSPQILVDQQPAPSPNVVVNVPPSAPPVINVDARTTIEPGAVSVPVSVPERQVSVSVDVEAPKAGQSKAVTFTRDEEGRITGAQVESPPVGPPE